MATLSTDTPSVDYTVVKSVTRTVNAGYNWLKLDDIISTELPEVLPGDVLGFKTTASGASIGYETFAEGDQPVEFSYTAAATTDGSILTVADGSMGHIKKHHVRAIASHPVADTFEYTFNDYGNYLIAATLSNALTTTPITSSAVVGVFSAISGQI